MFEDGNDTGETVTLQGTTRAWRAVLDMIRTPFDMGSLPVDVLKEALLVASTFEMVLIKSHLLHLLL